MIATLRGEISQIEDNALIIEVGGVGLRVFAPAPLRTKLKVGEVAFLFTHLVVREGPKVALSVLSTMTLDSIRNAVFSDEPDILSRVPGVGKKTAQKMALHLKDKLKPGDGLSKLAAISDTDSEVLAALTSLGYSVVEAQAAIQSIPKDAPKDVEERLRITLQYFQG
jgi:Holliday junction DNA helicase RuvA